MYTRLAYWGTLNEMKSNIRVIQSIQRAIDIINCFNEVKPELSITEISEQLSLHINTTRGIINTLVYNGFLTHDLEKNKYSLGLVFIPKADLVNANSVERIKEIVRPYLSKIANKYMVSSRFQLISNYNIFTIETFNPENSRYILLTRLNTPFPLNATSSGKLYLYYLDSNLKEKYLNEINPLKYTDKTITNRIDLETALTFIENNGYSTEYEEVAVGISSIAVPLLTKSKSLKGTISITASSTVIESVLEGAVADIKESINEIARKLDI